MLVAVARIPARRDVRGAPPDATVPVPEPLRVGPWRELLTGRMVLAPLRAQRRDAVP
jgi:hypothetical protein